MAKIMFMLLAMALASEAVPRQNSIPKNPSVLVRLHTKGVDQFLKSTFDFASKYSSKIPIADVNKNVNSLKVSAKNMRVINFPSPTFNYTMINPNQCRGFIKLPAIVVEGTLSAERQTFIGNQEDSGYVVFNLTNVLANGQTHFGKFDNGYPKVDKLDCDTSLEDADMKVTGAKEKFFTDILGLVSNVFRPAYNTMACTVARIMTFRLGNNFLHQLPSFFNITRDVSVKFHGDYEIQSDHVDMRLFGKVNEAINRYVPAPFEETTDDSMMSFFISDALPKDIWYQMHSNHQFDFTINNQNPELYHFIQLSCKPEQSSCLGNALPQLAKDYGADALVEAKVKAVAAPEIAFTKGKSIVDYLIAMDLFIARPNSNPSAIFSANVTLQGSMQMKVINGALLGTVTLDKAQTVINGQYKAWEDKIGAVVKNLVEEQLNKRIFRKGLSLNLPLGFALEEPRVDFLDHALHIQTGFVYKPQFNENHQQSNGHVGDENQGPHKNGGLQNGQA